MPIGFPVKHEDNFAFSNPPSACVSASNNAWDWMTGTGDCLRALIFPSNYLELREVKIQILRVALKGFDCSIHGTH